MSKNLFLSLVLLIAVFLPSQSCPGEEANDLGTIIVNANEYRYYGEEEIEYQISRGNTYIRQELEEAAQIYRQRDGLIEKLIITLYPIPAYYGKAKDWIKSMKSLGVDEEMFYQNVNMFDCSEEENLRKSYAASFGWQYNGSSSTFGIRVPQGNYSVSLSIRTSRGREYYLMPLEGERSERGSYWPHNISVVKGGVVTITASPFCNYMPPHSDFVKKYILPYLE